MWKFFGYFVIVLIVLGVLIFIHELGHFLTARACGVSVKEFAIGMGPKIFSWESRKHKTLYAIRLFPIGGFVSMENEDGLDLSVAPDDEGAFVNKSVPKRFLITAAGALMNILLGFVLMAIIVFSTQNLGSTVIREFAPDAASSQKLMVNDEIVKVGNTRVHTWNELAYEIMNKAYEPIDVTVIRNGEKKLIREVSFGTFEDGGVVFGDYDFLPYAEEATLGNLIKHTFYRSISTVKMVVDSLIGLLTGRFGMDAVSGPIGVVGAVEELAIKDAVSFLYIVCVLTMNLGVFNLIPFPALDGGRLVFLAIEGVRGKPVNRNVEASINFVGIMLLFALMIFITFKDVLNLIF